VTSCPLSVILIEPLSRCTEIRYLARGQAPEGLKPGDKFAPCPGHIEVRLVKGQRLEQIGMALEDLAHLTRDGTAAWEIRRQEHGVGQKCSARTAGIAERRRAGQPKRQAAAGQPVGVCHGSGTRHGRWEKPGMDATRKPVTRDRFAERSVPHTRRADTYAEAESACARIGGVLQKLDRGEEKFESEFSMFLRTESPVQIPF
jgi:hypothetical protein